MTEMQTAVDRRQTMIVANDLFPLFKDGRKRCTFRKGERHINLGDLFFISTDPVSIEDSSNWTQNDGEIWMGCFLAQTVEVTAIVIQRLEDFTEEELAEDGFESLFDAFKLMKRFYPDLEMSSPMTMIYFEVPE